MMWDEEVLNQAFEEEVKIGNEKKKEESPKKAINEIIFPIYKGKDEEKRMQAELWNNNYAYLKVFFISIYW